jgi:multicomponent Na+:H+ antiporter subunit E
MMARAIALVITWVALWGEANVANIVTGVGISLLISVLFPSSSRASHHVSFIGSVLFLGRFVLDLFVSSFVVTRTVLFPTESRLHTHVVTVPLRVKDPLVATVIANAMTLTPGTMTVAVDDASFEIKLHVLGDAPAESIEQHVRDVETRVLRALKLRTTEDGQV